MTKVIGITGLKRHGKGEVGEAIKRLVPGSVAVGFADKLKISMMRSLGFERPEAELIALADSLKVTSRIAVEYHEPNEIDLPEFPRMHELSGRQLLQWFGTEGGRKTFGEDFWIDQTLPRDSMKLLDLYGTPPIIAVTDVRFNNEAERIKSFTGGVMWKVVRTGTRTERIDIHASEAGVDPALIDATIINDSDLDTLGWRVEQALELEGPC